MFNRNFKDVLSSSGPDQPKTPPKSRLQRLAEVAPPIFAEVLERRRLFDSASIVGGVLVVTGDTTGDSIEVYESGGEVFVDFEQTPFASFPISNITAGYVSVSALAGNDTVKIYAYPSAYELSLPALVYGGDGNDTIEGSSHATADSLYGDAGNDTVGGSFGGDVIYGGDGNDSLNGGPDNDFIYGGAGYDILHGDDGNDELRGEGDGDSIWGDDGNDVLRGGDGDDQLHANDGLADTVHGDAGSDSATIDGLGLDTYTTIESLTT